MINERSVDFVNKFFSRVSALNESGTNILDYNVNIKIDLAMLTIINVPSKDDDLIMTVRHINHLLGKVDGFMSTVGAFGINARWAYTMASSLIAVSNAKLKDCYVQLRKNRGDKSGFDIKHADKVFHGHQGRMD